MSELTQTEQATTQVIVLSALTLLVSLKFWKRCLPEVQYELDSAISSKFGHQLCANQFSPFNTIVSLLDADFTDTSFFGRVGQVSGKPSPLVIHP